jgi:hypothetical protein
VGVVPETICVNICVARDEPSAKTVVHPVNGVQSEGTVIVVTEVLQDTVIRSKSPLETLDGLNAKNVAGVDVPLLIGDSEM